jgi:hypothetical protein
MIPRWRLLLTIAVLLLAIGRQYAAAQAVNVMRCVTPGVASPMTASINSNYALSSACLYHTSCAHKWPENQASASIRTSNGLTKTLDNRDADVNAISKTIVLKYTFQLIPGTSYYGCNYSIGTSDDTVYAPAVPASEVWKRLLNGPTGLQPILDSLAAVNPGVSSSDYYVSQAQINYMSTTTLLNSLATSSAIQDTLDATNSVIRYMINSVTNPGSVYQCIPPAVRANDGTFCAYQSTWTASCNEFTLNCYLDNSVDSNGNTLYSCDSTSRATLLTSNCHVTPAQLGVLLNNAVGSDTANAMCRTMAIQCSTAPVKVTDTFNCKFPYVAASVNNSIVFCDKSPQYSDIYVACNGKCLHCVSQYGPTNPAGTRCRPVGAEDDLLSSAFGSYWSGDLYLNCLFKTQSNALVALYNQSALLPGGKANFTCLDAYMTNSTVLLDPVTSYWVSAVPVGSNFATRRRLLSFYTEIDGLDPAMKDAGVFVGHAHQFLGHSKKTDRLHHMRYTTLSTPHHRAGSWMEGTHPLHPNYERVPWISLPPVSIQSFLNPDVDATTLPRMMPTHLSSSWYRPGASYESTLHVPLSELVSSPLTLHTVLESARLLHHLVRNGHPIEDHGLRIGLTPEQVSQALVYHFRRHQRRLLQSTSALVSLSDSATTVHLTQGMEDYDVDNDGSVESAAARTAFAEEEEAVGPRRRLLQAYTTTTIQVQDANNQTLNVTRYNLPADPLANYYAPVCSSLLNLCNNDQMRCTYYDRYYVAGRKNRNTFCANNLIRSCMTPNQTYVKTYMLQCSAGLYLYPHNITCTYNSDNPQECYYACQINGQTRSLSGNSFAPSLTLSAYPVPASMILDPSLDAAAGYEYRCDQVRQIASSNATTGSSYNSNFFWCITPLTPVPYSPTDPTDTRMSYICYDNTASLRNYTLDCGMFTLHCFYQTTAVNGQVNYTCESKIPYIAGVTDYLNATWRTTNVPVEWLIANSKYNVDNGFNTMIQQCINIRELAKTQSTPNGYRCQRTADGSHLNLYDNSFRVCSLVYDATLAAQSGLVVPLLVCPLSGIIVNCTFVPFLDPNLNVLTGRFVCAPDLKPASTRNNLLINNHQFAMACTSIDASQLMGYGVNPGRGDLRAISATDSRLSVTSQDACMFIKRSCRTPGLDFFGCNTIYQQDTSLNQFCDIAPPSPPIEYPPFTCGTHPQHAIFCSNHDTALNGWLRCGNYLPSDWVQNITLTDDRMQSIGASTQILGMDCSINAGVFSILHEAWFNTNLAYNTTAGRQQMWVPKPTLCNQVRVLCSFNVTTAPVVSVMTQLQQQLGTLVLDDSALGKLNQVVTQTIGNAATYLSADQFLFDPNDNPRPAVNSFDCRLPARTCSNVFCQMGASNISITDTNAFYSISDAPPSFINASNTTTADTCTPAAYNYNLMCQGVPIRCSLNTLVINGITYSTYSCSSTHTSLQTLVDNAAAQGLPVPYVAQNGLACDVDYSIFTSIESMSTVCAAIGAQCVLNNGVSCISGFDVTPEAPFCTLHVDTSPGSPMFECSDLAVNCQWDSFRNWMVCSAQPGSDIWSISSQQSSAFQSTNGQAGCVIASGSNVLNPNNNIVRFFQNVTERCRTLDQLCQVTCKPGYRTRYDANGYPEFCEPDAYDNSLVSTFQCNGQRIDCELERSNKTRSASISYAPADEPYVDLTSNLRVLYLSDPDYGRHHRTWQCHNVSAQLSPIPDSLMLDCTVTGAVLQYADDACSAIVSGCRANAGTLQCLGSYRSTTQDPFCTTALIENVADNKCDCGVWWSNEVQVIPSALADLTCAKRGYLSVADYLAQCLSDPDPLVVAGCSQMQMDIYGKSSLNIAPTTPYKQNWCLYNYTMPTAICASSPGQSLPLCTVECPPFLTKTTLLGSSSEYCCAGDPVSGDDGYCATSQDTRNCVLGKHANAWYQTNGSMNVMVNGVLRQVDRAFYPDQPCPSNPLLSYTAFPVTTDVATTTAQVGLQVVGVGTRIAGTKIFADKMQQQSALWKNVQLETVPPQVSSIPTVTITANALQYTQARDLTVRWQLWGFVVYTGGLYFFSRPPQLPSDVLKQLEPRRLLQMDDEANFHLHRVPLSQTAKRATVFRRYVASTFFLERNYGFECDGSTTDFNWRDYLAASSAALARVEQRVFEHYVDAGLAYKYYTNYRYSDLGATLASMTMVTTAYSTYTSTTNFNGCDMNVNPTGCGDNGNTTVDYQAGAIGVFYIDRNLVVSAGLGEHIFKRVFFINLIREDLKDGIPLSAADNAVANQTIREFVQGQIYPTTQPNLVNVTLLNNDCINIYNESTTSSYADLGRQKRYNFIRRIPIWGRADGTITTRVYVYDAIQGNHIDGSPLLYGRATSRLPTDGSVRGIPLTTGANQLTFADRDYSLTPYVLVQDSYDATNLVSEVILVGHIDLPDDSVFFVEFSSFWALYAYYAWRDWNLIGHRLRGAQRIGPNKQCPLRNQLWFDTPYLLQNQLATADDPVALLQAQPLCVVPRCPMPISSSYVWPRQTTGSSTSSTDRSVSQRITFVPNPADSEIAKDWYSLPCDGHGVCVSDPHGLVAQGKCRCKSGFETQDTMDYPVFNVATGLYETPSGVKNPSCGIDTRASCYDVQSMEVGVCGQKGVCVTDFTGTTQVAKCKCGRFPSDCNEQSPRSCEALQLKWQTNGYDELYQCVAPVAGCRNNTKEWVRPSGPYGRTHSYGCEIPRTDAGLASSPGTCVVTTPATATTPDQWACNCKSGYYGNQCQYPTLSGGCFDPNDSVYKRQFLATANSQQVTTCFWNPEVAQFQPWSWYDIHSAIFKYPSSTLFNISCRGVPCSGRGVCTHPTMNNYAKEVYNNPLEENNLDTLSSRVYVSPAKAAFQESVRQAMLAQTCQCAPGYSGPQCQIKQCAQPCLNGAPCINTNTETPKCACPMIGKVYLTSDTVTCGGIVCSGHGNLTKTYTSSGSIVWGCSCLPGWKTPNPATSYCSVVDTVSRYLTASFALPPSTTGTAQSSSSSSSSTGTIQRSSSSSSTGAVASLSSSSSTGLSYDRSSSSSTGVYIDPASINDPQVLPTDPFRDQTVPQAVVATIAGLFGLLAFAMLF